ncbi:MAG: hypothetical protein IPH54_08030 [Rhodoferax sp.]|nr:hypothetical protein [Rhodoferax sp.]
MNFFTGARMHVYIAAFSSGVPVVPMAYSRKFNGLFGTLGYVEIADCRRETTETVIENIMGGYKRRSVLGAVIAQCLNKGPRLVYTFTWVLLERTSKIATS